MPECAQGLVSDQPDLARCLRKQSFRVVGWWVAGHDGSGRWWVLGGGGVGGGTRVVGYWYLVLGVVGYLVLVLGLVLILVLVLVLVLTLVLVLALAWSWHWPCPSTGTGIGLVLVLAWPCPSTGPGMSWPVMSWPWHVMALAFLVMSWPCHGLVEASLAWSCLTFLTDGRSCSEGPSIGVILVPDKTINLT